MSAGLIEIPGYVTRTWTIDPAHSDVGFVIRHLMISNVRGHFTRFEGLPAGPAYPETGKRCRADWIPPGRRPG
jgi:YceI-like domain